MRYYDSIPDYPDKHFYIKYYFVDSNGRRDVEFWTDNREEYLNKLQFINLHYNYHTIKQRYPKRRG